MCKGPSSMASMTEQWCCSDEEGRCRAALPEGVSMITPVEADFDAWEEFLEEYESVMFTQEEAFYASRS